MKTRQHMLGSLIAASLILGGCSVGAQKPAEIKIISPTNNASVRVGQGINIQWTAKGDNISMIEVVITNQPYAQVATQDPKKGVPEFNAQVPWTPLQPGTHSIQVKAYNPDNKVIGQSDLVVLTAQGALPTATAAVPPTAVPAATAVGGGGQPAATAPTATPEAPSLVVTNDFANIREGPNTAYRALGQLSKDEKAPVRGRSDDGKWYQITFKTGVGWIFGELVQANDAANKTAVAAAPPLPTAPPPPPPTATSPPPTAAPPTAVPVVGRTAGNLTVDRVAVGNNGSIVASWNVQNIREAFLDKGDGQGYKAAAGTMSVVVDCITNARTIRLKITNNAGATQEDAIGINVDGGLPAGTCAGSSTGGSTDACNSSSPYWMAVKSGNSSYTFCAKQDLEFVAGLPPVVRLNKGSSQDLTLKWNLYGISGIRLKIESNTQQCGQGGSQGQRDVPVNGSNGNENFIYQLNANEFGYGGFKIELFVTTNSGQVVGYNEKFLCFT
ncbi:MAG: SH3 domain-containing protein [Thermoflexales bacterium]|nr:SH3 domain-containing protein [Thermoflexales bacterium]